MSKDLRDRLDGHELDLSMDSLSVVPVKELAALPRATHLDLSCNLLQTLPDTFCTLAHLIKVDLSKNKLTCLPIDFGALNRLQHLDLFENQLTTLPVTMFKMKNLKYLDVKSNPLNETLLKVAGDCLDDLQCRQCAKKVITFMEEVNVEQERRLQKLLQKQKEIEEQRRAEETKERQRIKAAKLALKEKKRQEYDRKHSLKKSPHDNINEKCDSVEDESKTNVHVETSARRSRIVLCIGPLSILVILVAILVGLVFHCDKNRSSELCRTGLQFYAQAQHRIETLVDEVKTRMT